jgi:hypothetical protein
LQGIVRDVIDVDGLHKQHLLRNESSHDTCNHFDLLEGPRRLRPRRSSSILPGLHPYAKLRHVLYIYICNIIQWGCGEASPQPHWIRLHM